MRMPVFWLKQVYLAKPFLPLSLIRSFFLSSMYIWGEKIVWEYHLGDEDYVGMLHEVTSLGHIGPHFWVWLVSRSIAHLCDASDHDCTGALGQQLLEVGLGRRQRSDPCNEVPAWHKKAKA